MQFRERISLRNSGKCKDGDLRLEFVREIVWRRSGDWTEGTSCHEAGADLT